MHRFCKWRWQPNRIPLRIPCNADDIQVLAEKPLLNSVSLHDTMPTASNNKIDHKRNEHQVLQHKDSSATVTGKAVEVVDVLSSILSKSRQGRTLGSEGTWDNIDNKALSTVQQLSMLQRRSDQDHRRQKRISDWDANLDSGRIKKLKKTNVEQQFTSSENLFQKATESMSKKK